MKNDGITIIVPVYNEERSIKATIKEIKRVMNKTRIGYEIIMVNDGSTDKSKLILEKEKGSA